MWDACIKGEQFHVVLDGRCQHLGIGDLSVSEISACANSQYFGETEV